MDYGPEMFMIKLSLMDMAIIRPLRGPVSSQGMTVEKFQICTVMPCLQWVVLI